jgi:hypothetical protein
MQTERTITERTTSQDTGAKALSAQEYLHTLLAAVVVPLTISAVTGVLVGVLALIIALWWRVKDAWVWGLAVMLAVMLGMWLALLTRWMSLTSLETLTGIDINRDGVIGKPKSKGAPSRVVQVNLRTIQNSGHLSEVRMLRFPGEAEAMVMFATALLGGASMSERNWCGDGKLFSKENYRAIKKIMEENKLFEPKNEKDTRQGYRLTQAGVQTMEQIRDTFAGSSTPPPGFDD